MKKEKQDALHLEGKEQAEFVGLIKQRKERERILLSIEGVKGNPNMTFSLECLEHPHTSNLIDRAKILDCDKKQFNNYLLEFQSTAECNAEFLKKQIDKFEENLNKNEENLTIKEQLERDYHFVQEFIKKPEAKEQGLLFAKQVNRVFRSWFTMKEFVNKFKTEEHQASISFQMLTLLNLLVSKEDKSGQILFKITLTDQDKLNFLKLRLKELELEGDIIRREINNLEKKIK